MLEKKLWLSLLYHANHFINFFHSPFLENSDALKNIQNFFYFLKFFKINIYLVSTLFPFLLSLIYSYNLINDCKKHKFLLNFKKDHFALKDTN
jgi:hypothetical protein